MDSVNWLRLGGHKLAHTLTWQGPTFPSSKKQFACYNKNFVTSKIWQKFNFVHEFLCILFIYLFFFESVDLVSQFN